MTRSLTLREGGALLTATLSESEAAALSGCGLATTLRTPTPGEWQLVPGRKVGTVRIGPELQVSVTPKVEVDRLIFMMGYARNPTFWRDDPVQLPEHVELPEALAHTFQRLATKALEQGILHGYRTVEDSLQVVRGRIRTDDQLRLRFEMPLPVEVRYDEFTPNIAENQILLLTVLRLLHLPQLSQDVRAGLQRLRMQLTDVELQPAGTPIPTWRPSRLNARYEPALHVAELILASTSFEQLGPGTASEVSGFVFDAWKIFEDFVCVALAEALAARPGRAILQHRDKLDVAGRIPIEPDFTWWDGNRSVIVADAKYKREKPAGFPNADIYQVLAYCTALAVQDGHLIYAKGEAQPESLTVTNSQVQIHRHALDLFKEPKLLLAEVEYLGERIWRRLT